MKHCSRTPRLTALAAVGVAAALALVGCAPSTAAGPKPSATRDPANGKVSIMVGGLNKQVYLPFMLAQQLGYYKAEGLQVTLSDEPAGVAGTTNLLAGKVDGAGGFYDNVIRTAAIGQKLVSVVNMLTSPGEVELCRTDLKGKVKSPADFSGRKLGITEVGSATDALTQYLTKKAGVDPASTSRIGVGAGATLIGALRNKNVDCAMTTEPTASQAVSGGDAFLLIDMRTAAGTAKALGGEYPATSLFMQQSYVKQNPITVQKLVNAYVRTLKFIQKNDAATIAKKMPADYYTGVGIDAYVAALKGSKGIFNPNGIMPPDGPPTNLKVLSLVNADVRNAKVDLKQTYTDQFVKAAQ